jgi:hypothetical protein
MRLRFQDGGSARSRYTVVLNNEARILASPKMGIQMNTVACNRNRLDEKYLHMTISKARMPPHVDQGSAEIIICCSFSGHRITVSGFGVNAKSSWYSA